MPAIDLLDPAGHTRGTCEAPATPETLLRLALGLRPEDSLHSIALRDDCWALAVVRAGPPETKVSILWEDRGTWETGSTASLIEAAWQSMLDDGWTTRPRSSTPGG